MRPRLRSWRHASQPFQPHETFQVELRHKDLHTYSHAHVFVFSPQPAASFRDKTCLVNSILMWIICCTAGYSDSSREGNHTATVMETCSRVPITQQGQSGHVRSRTPPPPDRAKKKVTARHGASSRGYHPHRSADFLWKRFSSLPEVSIASGDKSRLAH